MSLRCDTQISLQDYTDLLSGIEIEHDYLTKLNKEYENLLLGLYKCLFDNDQLDRQDEFHSDFKMFKDDMIRKYSSKGMYGYNPRSPMEKRLGICNKKESSKKFALEHRELEDFSPDDYSMRP